MRPANGPRCRLREAEKTHFAFTDKIGHSSHRLLNGRVRVHTMLVVEVDDLDSQTTETGLAGLAHVVRPSVHSAHVRIVTAHNAKLGG